LPFGKNEENENEMEEENEQKIFKKVQRYKRYKPDFERVIRT